MKKILLFTLLFSQLLFPQLKELEVKPTENRGGIPIFRDHPDKAGIIFYTQFDDLKFYSSYGIVEVKGDPAGGKYVVIIEPVKQTLEVRAPGFKTEMIRLEGLQPRDVTYYEVLPKKDEGLLEVSEVGITVQVSPHDAEIMIDGVQVQHDWITPVKLGKHTLLVTKSGYSSYNSDIEVTPNNTLFKVVLEQVKLAQVQIISEPQGAEIRINGDLKGSTDKGLFLFPGEYELGLSKDEYLPVNQKIIVTGDERNDRFKHILIKNRGYLEITIDPAGATLKINNQITDFKTHYELPPGEYSVEVVKDLFLPFSETVQIFRGETIKRKISLTQNYGTIKITSIPSEATLKLNGSISPSSGQYDLIPGVYIVELSSDKYLPKKDTIILKSGEIINRNYSLIKNRGNFNLTVLHSNAVVRLNGERITEYRNIEVIPGNYILEVTKDLYLPYSETIVINPGETAKRTISLTQNYGTIKITSTPSDATLKLNGSIKSSSGDYDLIPGVYHVELSSDKYLPMNDTIILKSGETVNRNYSLIKNRGNFNLTVLPSNAVVKLNGERITDYRNIEVIPGNYTLEVTADQHLPFSEKFVFAIGTVVKRDIKLEKNTGRLILTTTPDDAEIFVNKERQTTKEIEVGPGLYEITIKKETYQEQSFTIDIKIEDLLRREIKLKAITGTFQFAVSPLESEVILERDGEKVFEWKGMKLFDSLRTGSYELTVKSKNYKTIRKSITIRENQTTVEDILMTPGSDTPEGMVLVEGNGSVSNFLIGKYEVTQAIWESVMGSNPSYFKGANRPVEQVSWYDAVEFCNKLSEKEGLQKAYSGSGSSIRCDFAVNGYRLPTEVEWEYAARDGNKSNRYDYAGSDDIDVVAWNTNNSGSQTKEVGKKQPNELGIYDMSGNVWEWCWDLYSNSGSGRVLRGGGWYGNAGDCRVANRYHYDPGGRGNGDGFRLVRTR